jgi:hypothetical protein
MMRKQLEEFKQQQRRNNLSQRNKELRLINASKIVTTTQKESALGPSTLAPPQTAKPNVSIEKQTVPSALTMKFNNDRQRSQSCVDYKSMKGKTMESYRKPTRSQERNAEMEQAAEQMRLQPQRPQKPVPNTTTNRGIAKSIKQRSFVDEITKLTQQVERELGLGSGHQPGRTQSTHLTVHSKMMLKQQHQARGFLNETADSGGAHD